MAKLKGLAKKLLTNADDIARYGDDVADAGHIAMNVKPLNFKEPSLRWDWDCLDPYSTGRFYSRLDQINKHLDKLDDVYGLEYSHLRNPKYVSRAPGKYNMKLTELYNRLNNEIPTDLRPDARSTLQRLKQHNPEDIRESDLAYWEEGAYLDVYDPLDDLMYDVHTNIQNRRLQRTIDKKIAQGYIKPHTVIPDQPYYGSPMNDLMNQIYDKTQLYGVRPGALEIEDMYQNLPWRNYELNADWEYPTLKGRRINTVGDSRVWKELLNDDDLPF